MRKIKILLLILSLVFTAGAAACDQPQESSPSLVKVPFDHAFECEPGTFWLRDVFLTAEIQTEDQVYRSETAYLVVRTEFDFENYALKECGVTVYNYDSSDDRSYYYINYFRTDRGFFVGRDRGKRGSGSVPDAGAEPGSAPGRPARPRAGDGLVLLPYPG